MIISGAKSLNPQPTEKEQKAITEGLGTTRTLEFGPAPDLDRVEEDAGV